MTPLQAHVRMLENTPRDRVKTHYRHSPQEVGENGGRARLPVEIKGVVYPSLNDAARALGLSRQTVRNMVRRGEAFLR